MVLNSCGSSKSASGSDDLSGSEVMEKFDREQSGNKIIYTNEDEKTGNYDVETSVDSYDRSKDSGVLYSSLADRLRKIGGLTISGTGNNVKVLIRGMSSIKFSNEPIFVVDGFNLGRGYARANNSIDVNQIKSIRVLKGPAQTALYGEEGKNGVIIIKTK